MSLSGPLSTRDAGLYVVLFLGCAFAATVLGWLALSSRAWRAADDTGHVWMSCLAAVPWLVAAAVAVWRSRGEGSGTWLVVAGVLFAAWLASALITVYRGDTPVRFWAAPLVALGVVLAGVLAMVTRGTRGG